MRLSSGFVGFDSPLLGERERHGCFHRWSTWAQDLARRGLTACMYKIVVKSQLHRRSRWSRAACQPRSVKKFGSRPNFPYKSYSQGGSSCLASRASLTVGGIETLIIGLGSKLKVNRVRATDRLLSSCSALQPDPIFYLSQTLSIHILTFPYHSAGMIGGDALLVQEVE